MTDKPLTSRVFSRLVHTFWRAVFATFGPGLDPTADGPVSTKGDPEYAVVLTSCGRFDLLEKTVRSLLAHLDVPPAQFIVVEDSGDEKVYHVLSRFDAPFEVILNSSRLGQAASIDRAYERVRTPLVFHCEDDWEFFRGGFIRESMTILAAFPAVSLVGLRGRYQREVFADMPVERLKDVEFFRARLTMTGDHRKGKVFSYSYNPGLRRLSDWRRLGPFASIGIEGKVSWLFRMLGYAIAHLENPAVRHLGSDRHVSDTRTRKRSRYAIATRAWLKSHRCRHRG